MGKNNLAAQAVIKAFHQQPGPTAAGQTAGSRGEEGRAFREIMRTHLERPGVQIETAFGKSSKGTRLDGNACERISHKMLKFKRDPANADSTLVVAFNFAFDGYKSPLNEFREHAAYLNSVGSGASIVILATEQEYVAWLNAP